MSGSSCVLEKKNLCGNPGRNLVFKFYPRGECSEPWEGYSMWILLLASGKLYLLTLGKFRDGWTKGAQTWRDGKVQAGRWSTSLAKIEVGWLKNLNSWLITLTIRTGVRTVNRCDFMISWLMTLETWIRTHASWLTILDSWVLMDELWLMRLFLMNFALVLCCWT